MTKTENLSKGVILNSTCAFFAQVQKKIKQIVLSILNKGEGE